MKNIKTDFHENILKVMKSGVSKHLVDASLTLVWGNDAFYRLLDCEKEEFQSRYHEYCSCFEAMPQYFEVLKKAIAEAQKHNQEHMECDLIIQDIHGQQHWIRCSGTMIPQKDQTIIYFIYTIIDDVYHSQQLSQESLDECLNDLEWMMSEYTGNVYISDMDTYELLYVNQRACDTLQRTEAQLIGKKCYKAIQGRTSPCPFCTNAFLKKKETYSWEFYNPVLKRTFIIKDRALNWKGHKARIELSYDMYTSEYKLAKKDQEREAILKTIPGGMARIDARDSSTVLWYNGIFLDMIGYTKEQFESELHSQCDYLNSNDLRRIQKMVKSLKHTGDNIVFEAKAYTRAKEERLWTVTLCYISAEDSWDGIPSYYSVGLDVTEERKQMEKLRYKAEKDALTGIYNRETLQSYVDTYIAEHPNSKNALFMIDTDDFKLINDTHGHMVGDIVLSEMAAGMKKIMRKQDLVGRIGGDEFAIFMEEISSYEDAKQKAKELVNVFHHLFDQEKKEIEVSCSIGIAIYPEDGDSFNKLYGCADKALYQAKTQGKNGYALFDSDTMDMIKMMDRSSYVTSIDSEQSYAESTDNLARYVFRILYQMDDIKTAIQMILEIVGKQFDVSRAYVFESTEDGAYTNNTYEWCNEGVTAQMKHLQHISYADLHDYTSLFNDQGIFYCRDIHTLDEELIKVFDQQDIHSTLQCAIKQNDFFAGFIGFDECSGLRLWTKEEVSTLTLIAQILAVFMQLKPTK